MRLKKDQPVKGQVVPKGEAGLPDTPDVTDGNDAGAADTAVGYKLPGDPGDRLSERMEKLAWSIEKMNLAEYTALLTNPWRLVWVNLIAGAARGVGYGIGFAVLTVLLLYILRGLMLANLPFFGDFIAEVVRLVEFRLNP